MDTGWKARLDILKRDAERKIISQLKIHGWETKITSEVSKGDYITIETSRGGHSHKIALMYSSATDNAIYKQLQTQVEHIYINSDLYKLNSYAYGITTPVTSASDFQEQLLEWNKTSANGLFVPTENTSDDESFDQEPTKLNRIQSENPLQSVWIHLRQLESVTLAKKSIIRRASTAGVKIDESIIITKSEGLAFALRNASDYFRSAEGRNMSQRILNLYYGTLAFAFAEMLASPSGPATLAEIEDSTKQGHGLFTADGKSDKLEDLIIGVIKSGFYSTYMSFLGHPTQNLPTKKGRKLEDLTENQFWVTFEDLFGRIPDVGDLFTNIFESKPGWIIPAYDSEANASAMHRISKKIQRSYALLIDHSGRWRKEDIVKLGGPISEIAELQTKNGSRKFRVAVDHAGHDNFWPALQIHRSPYIDHTVIAPVFGSVNQYRAICLAILYSLSIIVRYRPSLWRRVQEGDLDYMRVLIEAYLDSIERILPEQFLETITGQTVITRQPGSFF